MVQRVCTRGAARKRVLPLSVGGCCQVSEIPIATLPLVERRPFPYYTSETLCRMYHFRFLNPSSPWRRLGEQAFRKISASSARQAGEGQQCLGSKSGGADGWPIRVGRNSRQEGRMRAGIVRRPAQRKSCPRYRFRVWPVGGEGHIDVDQRLFGAAQSKSANVEICKEIETY